MFGPTVARDVLSVDCRCSEEALLGVTKGHVWSALEHPRIRPIARWCFEVCNSGGSGSHICLVADCVERYLGYANELGESFRPVCEPFVLLLA